MHFGENQLSPCSFGILPLPTAHPITLQRKRVRPSTECYFRFSLAMGSSHGFGPTRRDCGALFRLAFASAPGRNPLTLPRRVTRWLILQ